MENTPKTEELSKTVFKPNTLIIPIFFLFFLNFFVLNRSSEIPDFVREKGDCRLADTSIQKENRSIYYIKAIKGGIALRDTIIYRHTEQKDSIVNENKTISTLTFIDIAKEDTVFTTLSQTKIRRIVENDRLTQMVIPLNSQDSSICESLKSKVVHLTQKHTYKIICAAKNALLMDKCKQWLFLKTLFTIFMIFLVGAILITNTKPNWKFRNTPLVNWFVIAFYLLMFLKVFEPFIEPNTKPDPGTNEYLNVNIDTYALF